MPCSNGENVPTWTLPLRDHRHLADILFSSMIKLFSSLCLVASVFAPGAVEAVNSRACGQASHYGVGDGYHGRQAADGSRFNAYGLTTAHPSLPFGSSIEVTNQRNGKSVVVKVTDRGPFIAGRVLDLSYGAFSRISSPGSGVATVCYLRV